MTYKEQFRRKPHSTNSSDQKVLTIGLMFVFAVSPRAPRVRYVLSQIYISDRYFRGTLEPTEWLGTLPRCKPHNSNSSDQKVLATGLLFVWGRERREDAYHWAYVCACSVSLCFSYTPGLCLLFAADLYSLLHGISVLVRNAEFIVYSILQFRSFNN